VKPDAGLLPKNRAARASCRSICGEMHSGFSNLRSALPMNIKGRFPGFKIWAGAAADVARVLSIWNECLADSKGPFLFGRRPCMADAMYAPVCTRFLTYDVKLDPVCAAYCDAVMGLPEMQEWVAAAKAEHEEVLELDVEF
jgi:glutathione S-transferase